MKKALLICLLAVFSACYSNSSQSDLVWGSDTLLRSNANDVVALSYPVALEGMAADSINQALSAYLKEVFAGDSLASNNLSLVQAVDSLLARKNRDTLMARFPYQMQSEGGVYTRAGFTSVWVQSYAFTGGAHGLTLGKFFNFDNRTAQQLPLDRLFKDTARLSEINRAAFKQYLSERALSCQEIELYLFVTPDKLPLPQNVGFDSTGVKMLYNPYEIAAYVFGQSTYTIPYNQLEALLRETALDKKK